MFVKDVLVKNQVGLHARPATFFIQKANEFKSSIWVERDERRVNAKSLLGVLSLGILGGSEIRIIADGTDEQAAVEALVELVESGFAEQYFKTLWADLFGPYYKFYPGVAQFGRALEWGSRGRWFDSSHSDQKNEVF